MAMSPELVMEIARQAIKVTLLVSLPILGIGLLVGVLISLLQAATQIQEMTLTFVPKILSIFVGLLLLLPWIMNHLTSFFIEVVNNMPYYIR
jgi:flagellar biosynthetic protein FliQ